MLKYIPISETHAATLSRLMNNLLAGYTFHARGSISADRVAYLAQKFHRIHRAAATPSQRHTRKKKGLANALLTIYLAPDADFAEWFLQFTPGELSSPEQLQDATKKPFLTFAHYELVRVAKRNNPKDFNWSFRRNKESMSELHDKLKLYSHRKHYHKVKKLLERAAAEPQFHLVREQTKRLLCTARKYKYRGELPFLFYMTRVSHGSKQQPVEDKK